MPVTEEDRVRLVAFAITSRFEGGGYHTYQNYDTGIISYGRYQFTLASGTLGRIVTRYLERASGQEAERLRPFQARIVQRDPALRSDTALRDALIAAARDPVMQQIQDEMAVESYWDPTHQIAIQPRGIVLPLSRALLFDISINFGVGDGFLRMAERDFGVAQRSRLGDNGLTEAQLIRRVAELRKISHDRQAERENLPGLKVRGDFWLGIVTAGDWQLQGDASGNILIKGVPLQVRNPTGGSLPPDDPPPAGALRITPAQDKVNLRDQPNTGSSIIIGTANPGDILTVLEEPAVARPKIGNTDNRQWVRIRTADGLNGFTAAWLYRIHEEEPPPPPPPPVEPLHITPAAGMVNLRDQPTASGSTIIGTANPGDILTVTEDRETALPRIGNTADRQWVAIRTETGLEGFTAAWLYRVYKKEETPPPGGELHLAPTVAQVFLRSAPVSGDVVDIIRSLEVIRVLEPAEAARQKVGVRDEWLNVQTQLGFKGHVAAWLFREYKDKLPSRSDLPADLAATSMTGINLDVFYRPDQGIGTPPPERLGKIGWVRLGYNVSVGVGSQDIKAAFDRHAPPLARYAAAGIKTVVVCTHQTFGEGAGYNWQQMTPDRWRDLINRYADMLGRIAAQYAGRDIIHVYQIWNEQDAEAGAEASVPVPPEIYGELLGKAATAIRAADPKARIITGGQKIGPGGANYLRTALQAAPAGLRVDGFAFHPYGRGDLKSETKYRHIGDIDVEIAAYDRVRPGTPLWITEWGVLNAPNEPPTAISRYATEFIRRLQAVHSGRVVAAIWYAWAQGMHNGYGIVDHQGGDRPPFTRDYTTL